MKVLVFTPQIHLLGGAEKLAVELAEGLNRVEGVTADLLCMGPQNTAGSAETRTRLLRNGVPSVFFLGRLPGSGMVRALGCVRRLRRLVRERNYDFLEVSMPGPTVLGCWATRGLGTVPVVGIHRIYGEDHQESLVDRVVGISARVNRRARFYAISESAKDHWVRYAKVQPEVVRVIYNSIDYEHFRNHKDEEGSRLVNHYTRGERAALFVGRLCKTKGLDTVVQALGPILEQQGLHLLVVGEPNWGPRGLDARDQQLVGHLHAVIEKNRWSSRIHFLGRRWGIASLMRAADLLVHPARKEGFGLVLAEALAAGLPVVATEVGGIPEVLAGTCSVLVPPGEPVALRDAVVRVLRRDPMEAARCRAKALRRAEFFRPERRISDMVAFLREISR